MDSSPFDQLSTGLILPDLWQQDAVRHLQDGKSVIVDAPTGAGKTRVFELLFESRHLHGQAVYTVPTRALANDKYREWKAKGWEVGIATGDIALDTQAPVIVATLETQLDRLHAGYEPPSILVIDEYQMIGDRQRGLHYETAIAIAPEDTQLLLLSGSVSNPREIANWLERIGREAEIVVTHDRPVPLEEMLVFGMPRQAPKKISGFWPRLGVSAILSELSPLLIFAPQRRGAEKLARQIASALPSDEGLKLTPEEEAICGKDLSRVLSKRVAFHHSGLPYPARAGIVEPLAKAGRLHVIVATTGLAAGINFSVRSVAMAGTSYMEGEFPRELGPDELLQMFGRAGRRGLDEMGHVLVTDRPPRLSDAAALPLHRTAPLDWPTVLRVMDSASEKEDEPFEAAEEFCGRLLSKEPVSLGFSRGEELSEAKKKGPALGPMRAEIRNGEGDWEAASDGSSGEVPMEESWTYLKKECRPANYSAQLVGDLLESLPGRICKLDGDRYGKETVLATRIDESDQVRLSKSAAKYLRLKRAETFSADQVCGKFAEAVEKRFPGSEIGAPIERGRSLVVRTDPSRTLVRVHLDVAGTALFAPEERMGELIQETTFEDGHGGIVNTRSGSAARAWRKLGLVEADGTVTDRGRIFSRFQGGEGLVIAVAVEDESYPIDELGWHIANVRAGRSFDEDFEGGPSERLAHVAHEAFGATDYPGYLSLGLPLGYGRGASEVLEARLLDRHVDFSKLSAGRGDVERTLSEWLSLLRHIRAAPDLGIDRWIDLQVMADQLLTTHGGDSPSTHLPPPPDDALSDRPPRRPWI